MYNAKDTRKVIDQRQDDKNCIVNKQKQKLPVEPQLYVVVSNAFM